MVGLGTGWLGDVLMGGGPRRGWPSRTCSMEALIVTLSLGWMQSADPNNHVIAHYLQQRCMLLEITFSLANKLPL